MESLMKYIGKTSRCAILYRNSKLEKEGLNGYQHNYILNICKHPGLSQEQLAQKIFVNKSNVTRQLNLLEQNGFITKKTSASDKRVILVFPTQKAHDIYPKVFNLLSEWNNYLLEDFTEEECLRLYSMMEHVMNKAIMRVNTEEGES